MKGGFDAGQALTGHKTEAVRRRYSTVAESDLREGAAKLAVLHPGGRQADVPPTHTNAHSRAAGERRPTHRNAKAPSEWGFSHGQGRN